MKDINNQDIYKTILESSHTAIYISDINTYKLLFMNQHALLLSKKGIDYDYYLKPCYKVIMNKDTPCEFCKVKKMSKDKFTTRFITYPENGRYYLMMGKKIEFQGKINHVEFISDYTKEKEESEIKELEITKNKLLLRCSNVLISDEIKTEKIEELFSILQSYYDTDGIYLLEVDHKKETVLINSSYLNPDSKLNIDFPRIDFNKYKFIFTKNLLNDINKAYNINIDTIIENYSDDLSFFSSNNILCVKYSNFSLHDEHKSYCILLNNCKKNTLDTDFFQANVAFFANIFKIEKQKELLEDRSSNLLRLINTANVGLIQLKTSLKKNSNIELLFSNNYLIKELNFISFAEMKQCFNKEIDKYVDSKDCETFKDELNKSKESLISFLLPLKLYDTNGVIKNFNIHCSISEINGKEIIYLATLIEKI